MSSCEDVHILDSDRQRSAIAQDTKALPDLPTVRATTSASSGARQALVLLNNHRSIVLSNDVH